MGGAPRGTRDPSGLGQLAQMVEETRIAAQETSGRVRLASSAAVPERPVNKRCLVYTAIGLALGLMVGVIGAFVLEYFREPPMSGRRLQRIGVKL